MTTASHSSLPQHLEKRRHEGAEMLLEVRGNVGAARTHWLGGETYPEPDTSHSLALVLAPVVDLAGQNHKTDGHMTVPGVLITAAYT